MINISFPGGAGGNWLLNLLCNESLPHNPINFHKHTHAQITKYSINLVHELDPTKFNYLYSGKSYFNFYLNIVYKLLHHDFDIFNQSDYKTHFLECVNTARFLCKFDQIYDCVFFNYDELIDSPTNFIHNFANFKLTTLITLLVKKSFYCAEICLLILV